VLILKIKELYHREPVCFETVVVDILLLVITISDLAVNNKQLLMNMNTYCW